MTDFSIFNRPVVRLPCIYLIWIVCHYIASHLYVCMCVPFTIMGFILSPFVSPAPHCQALRWTIYNAGATIVNMWILLGAWIISKFAFPNSD